MSTTNLEKTSLEAHVDLCAERYGHLQKELETLQHGQIATNTRLDNLERMVKEIVETLREKEHNALRSIIKIGASIIVALLGALSVVLWYVITNGAA